MSAYFTDSSALAKQYTVEVGSAWGQGIVDVTAGHAIYVASITEVEVTSSLSRKLREGLLTAAQRSSAIVKLHDDFHDLYVVTDVDEQVIARAVSLVQAYPLRGYDTVQLATALLINETRTSIALPVLTFVSADSNLNSAALSEGLTVDDPNAHP